MSRGVIISTFFSLLVAGGGYFIGSFSHLFFGETLPEGGTDYIVPLMLNSAGLPNLLIGVILVLLISASVSTLSSITLTACSTVSMDLIKASWLKGLGEKTLATVTRLLCLAFVVLSYLIANYPTPILEMMSYSWGILSGAFLAPYVLTPVSYTHLLVLLDIMLPGLDGWQVCREIRKKSSCPIIMLTAKGEVFDKVLGLELGADDYVVKPFETKEVIARIGAVLRRSGRHSEDKEENKVVTRCV